MLWIVNSWNSCSQWESSLDVNFSSNEPSVVVRIDDLVVWNDQRENDNETIIWISVMQLRNIYDIRGQEPTG